MGSPESVGGESLRRLHGQHDVTIHHAALYVSQRVGHRYPWHHGIGSVPHGGHHPGKQVAAGQRPGPVVDQHHLGIVRYRSQTGPYRCGTGGAAGHHRHHSLDASHQRLGGS